jgi:hypothetical protein
MAAGRIRFEESKLRGAHADALDDRLMRKMRAINRHDTGFANVHARAAGPICPVRCPIFRTDQPRPAE